MNLENEGTLGLYFYQSGFVDDAVLAEWESGNIQLRISSKKMTAVIMSPRGQEYRVRNPIMQNRYDNKSMQPTITTTLKRVSRIVFCSSKLMTINVMTVVGLRSHFLSV